MRVDGEFSNGNSPEGVSANSESVRSLLGWTVCSVWKDEEVNLGEGS